jgi:hypothetical protein
VVIEKAEAGGRITLAKPFGDSSITSSKLHIDASSKPDLELTPPIPLNPTQFPRGA